MPQWTGQPMGHTKALHACRDFTAALQERQPGPPPPGCGTEVTPAQRFAPSFPRLSPLFSREEICNLALFFVGFFFPICCCSVHVLSAGPSWRWWRRCRRAPGARHRADNGGGTHGALCVGGGDGWRSHPAALPVPGTRKKLCFVNTKINNKLFPPFTTFPTPPQQT